MKRISDAVRKDEMPQNTQRTKDTNPELFTGLLVLNDERNIFILKTVNQHSQIGNLEDKTAAPYLYSQVA